MINLKANVYCLDNLSTGRLNHIRHLQPNSKFSFIQADVNKWNPNEEFDFIVHGASIPSPEDYSQRPVDTMLPNSLGLFTLLKYAASTGAIILYTSTSEIYGDAELIPTPEEYWGKVNPIGIRSSYDESKRFGEAMCISFLRQYDVDVRIVRLFNTYGPRLDPSTRYSRVVPRLILQALRNKPLTIHSNGLQTRSFQYVTDTIIAILKTMQNNKAKGKILNIGSPQEISILTLAHKIKNLTASNSNFQFRPERPDDPKRRCPDISKAKKLLDWKPQVPLEEGLTHTIEWFKEENT
jgi:UDP-glucuronate decarboxylase